MTKRSCVKSLGIVPTPTYIYDRLLTKEEKWRKRVKLTVISEIKELADVHTTFFTRLYQILGAYVEKRSHEYSIMEYIEKKEEIWHTVNVIVKRYKEFPHPDAIVSPYWLARLLIIGFEKGILSSVLDYVLNIPDMDEVDRFLLEEKILRYDEGEGEFLLSEILEGKDLHGHVEIERVLPKKRAKGGTRAHHYSKKVRLFATAKVFTTPAKLKKALFILAEEEGTNVSGILSQLFIENQIHLLDPEEVATFSKKLQQKYPFVYADRKSVGYAMSVPAWLRLKAYLRKAQPQKRGNRERIHYGFTGLLYYLIGKKMLDL